LQSKKVELSNRALNISKIEIERNVRIAWWQVIYGKEQFKMLNELSVSYQKFANAAAKRYAAGDINKLEQARTESHYQQILLQKQQAEADLLIYEQQLQQWIADSSLTTPDVALSKIQAPIKNGVDGNPLMSYYEQNIAVTKQAFKVQQSGFLPDFSIGYINQQIEGVSGMSGLQFGIGIPLFFWTQMGKAQAAKLGNEIAQAEYESQLLQMTTAHQTKLQESAKYLAQVEWYEKQGLKTADELMHFANKSYEAGEINYIEYINSTDEAVKIKTAYLKTLNQYNQSIIYLQYLNGSFNN